MNSLGKKLLMEILTNKTLDSFFNEVESGDYLYFYDVNEKFIDALFIVRKDYGNLFFATIDSSDFSSDKTIFFSKNDFTNEGFFFKYTNVVDGKRVVSKKGGSSKKVKQIYLAKKGEYFTLVLNSDGEITKYEKDVDNEPENTFNDNDNESNNDYVDNVNKSNADDNTKDKKSRLGGYKNSTEEDIVYEFINANKKDIIIFNDDDGDYRFRVEKPLYNDEILVKLLSTSVPELKSKKFLNKLFILDVKDQANGFNLVLFDKNNNINEVVVNNNTISFNNPNNPRNSTNQVNNTTDDEYTFDELRARNINKGKFKDSVYTKQSLGSKLKAKLLNKMGIVSAGSGDALGMYNADKIARDSGLTKNGKLFGDTSLGSLITIKIIDIDNYQGNNQIVYTRNLGFTRDITISVNDRLKFNEVSDDLYTLSTQTSLSNKGIMLKINDKNNNEYEGEIFITDNPRSTTPNVVNGTSYNITFKLDN